jgi:hypothetical protein
LDTIRKLIMRRLGQGQARFADPGWASQRQQAAAMPGEAFL